MTTRAWFTELHRDERASTVTAFVTRALAFFAGHGIQAKRLQTDNAWAYTHTRDLAALLAARGIEHRRIPPRTPKRNGKVCVLASVCRPSGRRGSPRPVV
jgi:transposase InsO family protein